VGRELTGYSAYARFYDATQGDRAEHAAYIRSLLKKHHPRAKTVLELACGTGSILKQLQPHYEITGVDLSDEMLAIARKKVLGVRLVHGDMRTVDLGERFDVVLCVYDSINHLVAFRDWEAVFRRAREHLNDGGVFLFDINTVHRLAASAGAPPHVQWFGDGSLMVIAIVQAPRGAVDWEINVFERVRGSSYRLHLDVIREASFPTERMRAALRRRFTRIWTYDARRARPSAQSDRLHFVCRT
jgi:SAM-dependent methyltransferase